MNEKSSKPVAACAAGLIVAFFMPWAPGLFVTMSGYDIAQIGSYATFVWAVPVLAGATLALTFLGLDNRLLGAVTGLLPLGVVMYGFADEASTGGFAAIQREAGHMLIGTWLTIALCVAIVTSAISRTGREAPQEAGPQPAVKQE